MNKKLEGVVEGIGKKFNGSLLINGAWHNLKKGTVMPSISKGDIVELELAEWEFKGKTGVNVVKVTVQGKTKVEIPKPVEVKPTLTAQVAVIQNSSVKARDFDAEARGKTRCAVFCAALQSPTLIQYAGNDPESFLALVKKISEEGVKYSFGD